MTQLGPALRDALRPALLLMLVYSIAVAAGAVLAHRGSSTALKARDSIVSHAVATNAASRAYHRGALVEAAAWDFGGNLFAAITETVGGMAIVIPFGTAAYRGWVGGIVSVDGNHQSRLRDPRSAFYYLLTLLLQLIPYSLAGGTGIRMGLTYLRSRAPSEQRWLTIPKDALIDAVLVYTLVVPCFLLASAWEFLSPWNL
jgi:hypothetical protein